jgi:ABC-type transporter Mla MlaB component
VIRITVEETSEIVCLLVEGKLSGPWVAELESIAQSISTNADPKPLEIDLSGISGMDASGRSLLARFRADGVRLVNLDPLSESLLKMEVAA